MKEKLFFDLCEQFVEKYGEGTENAYVIDDHYPYDDLWTYKAYHKNGYCWDVKKEEAQPDEYGEPYVISGYAYSFSEIWGGFDNKGIDNAIELMKKELA